MTVTLEIPDGIAANLSPLAGERDARLLLELAAGLYAKGTISLAQGAEMAGLARTEFGEQLGERGIARHYGEDELNEDLAYANQASCQ